MCGIAGIVTREARPSTELQRLVTGMADRIQHRGPDDWSTWIDPSGRFATAHRRLSIVDLSPTGRQPMASASGRYVICFNGEIYNFRSLRKELESDGVRFRGTSDTEVLLEGMVRWGVDAAIRRAVGMFAIAVWDTVEQRLVLARDRMGEKPLLVARMPWGIAFASELRAFEGLPEWRYDVEPNAVASLLRFGYVMEDGCIDRKVTRLLPATMTSVRAMDLQLGRDTLALERYWNIEAAVEDVPLPDTPEHAVDHLEQLLKDCLDGQRVADVPLGSFLSGGIDSSVVTGVLQSISSAPVRTFSIGFEEAEYDESGYARAVANHIGCHHTEFKVTADDALKVIAQMPAIYDEPFADPSQVPTILVSRLARQAVTVCLSGDGGDELFGGYNRYFWSGRWGKRFQALPRPVRTAIGGAASMTISTLPDSVLRRIVSGQVGAGATQNPRGKLEKAVAMLRIDDPVHRYSQLTRLIEPDRLMAAAAADQSPDRVLRTLIAKWGEVFGAMLWDIDLYLPGDQLVRVDRASMSVSLEMRAPLLDHRIAAYAVAATRAFGDERLARQPKWLLREVLYRYVPKALVERPKMGFSIPLHRWLRVELRDWAEDLLAPAALQRHGMFQPAAVNQLWKEHLAGADHNRALWSVLMFQQWAEAANRRVAAVPAYTH